jgi:hypothetical protein
VNSFLRGGQRLIERHSLHQPSIQLYQRLTIAIDSRARPREALAILRGRTLRLSQRLPRAHLRREHRK